MGRYVATTSKVIDGNTIEVRYGHGHQHRISIRLANIDTADRDTQGTSSAAVFLSINKAMVDAGFSRRIV